MSYWTATYSNDAAPGGTIKGLGDAAFIQAAVPDVFVLQGREIADIRVQGHAYTNANTMAAIAIARAMLPRLGRETDTEWPATNMRDGALAGTVPQARSGRSVVVA